MKVFNPAADDDPMADPPLPPVLQKPPTPPPPPPAPALPAVGGLAASNPAGTAANINQIPTPPTPAASPAASPASMSPPTAITSPTIPIAPPSLAPSPAPSAPATPSPSGPVATPMAAPAATQAASPIAAPVATPTTSGTRPGESTTLSFSNGALTGDSSGLSAPVGATLPIAQQSSATNAAMATPTYDDARGWSDQGALQGIVSGNAAGDPTARSQFQQLVAAGRLSPSGIILPPGYTASDPIGALGSHPVFSDFISAQDNLNAGGGSIIDPTGTGVLPTANGATGGTMTPWDATAGIPIAKAGTPGANPAAIDLSLPTNAAAGPTSLPLAASSPSSNPELGATAGDLDQMRAANGWVPGVGYPTGTDVASLFAGKNQATLDPASITSASPPSLNGVSTVTPTQQAQSLQAVGFTPGAPATPRTPWQASLPIAGGAAPGASAPSPIPATTLPAPGSAPASAGSSVPIAATSSTGPGGVALSNADLTGSTIAPGATADRYKIAQDQFDTFAKASDPYYKSSIRDAISNGAGLGQLGSGGLRTSVGNLANTRGQQLDSARSSFLSNALNGSIDDAYRNVGVAQQQQGRQDSQQGVAFDQAARQAALQEALTQGDFSRYLSLLNAGSTGNPSDTALSLSNSYNTQAGQAGAAAGRLASGTVANAGATDTADLWRQILNGGGTTALPPEVLAQIQRAGTGMPVMAPSNAPQPPLPIALPSEMTVPPMSGGGY